MRLPAQLGLSPFGHPGWLRIYHQAMRRLQGSGYSLDEDGVRDRFLKALALAPAIAQHVQLRAAAQGHVSRATELLEELELIFKVPFDSERSVLQRQGRLALLEKLWAGGTIPGLERVVSEVDLAGYIVEPSVDIATSEDADPETGANVVAVVSDEVFADPALRSDITEAIWRAMPAKGRGIHTLNRRSAHVATQVDAKYNEATQFWNQVVLRNEEQSPAVPAIDSFAWARIASYGPGTMLRAEDMVSFQLQAPMWRSPFVTDGQSYSTGAGRHLYFQGSVGPSSTQIIDESIDYIDRILWVAIIFSTTDIRCGGANDSLSDWNSATKVIVPMITGAGGVSFSLALNADLTLRVDTASANELVIINSNGVSSYYFVALTVGSGKLGADDTAEDEARFFSPGRALDYSGAEVDATWLLNMQRGTRFLSTDTAATQFADVSNGAVRKSGAITRIPGSDESGVLIDTSVDWRDRIFIVMVMHFDATGDTKAVFPGNNEDQYGVGAAYFGYTEAGIDLGISGLVAFYANSAGNLCANLTEASAVDRLTLMYTIFASPQLGEYTSGDIPSFDVPADGTSIEPQHLNRIQDGGLMVQAQAPFQVTDPSIFVNYNHPLGPVQGGAPPVARYDSKYRPCGSIYRIVAATVGHNTTITLDGDGSDWRDRLVTASLRYNVTASQIWPGGSADTSFNTSTLVSKGAYFGPGYASGSNPADEDFLILVAANVWIFADEDTGNLMLRNNSGASRSVSGLVIGSFQLGPYSYK